MRAVGITLAAWAAVAVACLPSIGTVEAATKAERTRTAAKLLDETLHREAKEGVADRAALLKPVLEEASNCEAAWWQSGFVYDARRKNWLRWDEFQEQAAKDERLIAYRKVRAKSPETADGHLAMARWCSKRKLEDQAQAHWTRVLELDPDNAEARQRLGFRSINGVWMEEHDIADAQNSSRKAMAAAAKWAPRLQNLRNRMANGNAAQQEAARAEFLAIRDPDAVEAINVALCREAGEMALLCIELLTSIHTSQAASALAWHAAFSPAPQVRQAAAMALQSQAKQDYVPLLLDAAQIPSGTQSQTAGSTGSSGGYGGSAGAPMVRMMYRVDHVTSTRTWTTVKPLDEHPYWYQMPNARFNAKTPDPVAKKTTKVVSQGTDRRTVQKREYYSVRDNRVQELYTDHKVTETKQKLTPVQALVYPKAGRSAAYPQQPVAVSPGDPTAGQQNSSLNALAKATGAKGPQSPAEWRAWWYDSNEVYRPSGKVAQSADRADSPASADGASGSQRGDCLALGTLVQTETGAMPIEKVAVGDRVFCCDPETGRLVLKPVMQTTARPEGTLLKVRAGGETFEAAGGHVFWVAGRGWVKARDLREGMQLHTIRGSVPVEAVEPGTEQPSFSLVVSEFNSFFIGKDCLLTHDNTIRKPTNCTVPGLSARGGAKSP
jgi:hypothetical protein